MGFKVFVSHSSKDNEIVNSLYSVLKQSGIEVYAVLFSPEPGIQLSKKILEGIKTSDCVLVLLTSDSVISQWVQNEIGMAKALGKLIIPIVDKGVKVPSLLTGIEYIRFDKRDPLRTIEYIRNYFEQLKLRKEQNARFGLALAVLLLGLIILASD